MSYHKCRDTVQRSPPPPHALFLSSQNTKCRLMAHLCHLAKQIRFCSHAIHILWIYDVMKMLWSALSTEVNASFLWCCAQKWNSVICHPVFWFFIPIFDSLLCIACLSVYLYIIFFVVILSSACFLFLLIFHPCSFWILLSSSVVVTDPNSDCETLILKLGSGGFASCIVSMCFYFAASPPRSLSMTPGDDWVRCFHPWCRSDVTPRSPPPLSPSLPPRHFLTSP